MTYSLHRPRDIAAVNHAGVQDFAQTDAHPGTASVAIVGIPSVFAKEALT